MGSKKHKKESKKRKHKSRSRSPLDGEERERKRHKKHKDRKKDRSPDVEEVPVDSHLYRHEDNGDSGSPVPAPLPVPAPAPGRDSRSASEERDRRRIDREREERRERDPSPPASGGAQESLSVEETNRLRAKLGLKPLETHEAPAEDGKLKDDLGEFYHKPAANIAHQQKAEKIRQKLEERKEKRKLEEKLKARPLGELSDEEDAAAWVRRSRASDKQKEEAAKRAALLDELDEAFGVSALVAAEQAAERARAYSAGELRGLRVAHRLDSLADEQETILTLADKPVLAEDEEDVLVNVNIVDDEKYKKNILERRKARAGYQAYDDEAELEAAALGRHKSVLAKYDDEIEPERELRARGFRIGDEDALEAERFRNMMRAAREEGGAGRRLESLQLPALRPARDYLDDHEIQATFKKPKKKGKMRKKPKQEPIDVEEYEAAGAPLDTDDTVAVSCAGGAPPQDAEETEPDTELQAALARARRMRQQAAAHDTKVPKVETILSMVKEEPVPEPDTSQGMVLDATAEFCRTLGDIPTYGQAGNRDHHAEIMELEQAEQDMEVGGGAGAAGGAGQRGGCGCGRTARAGRRAAAGARRGGRAASRTQQGVPGAGGRGAGAPLAAPASAAGEALLHRGQDLRRRGRQVRAARARRGRGARGPARRVPREGGLPAQHQAGVRGRRGPPALPQGGVPLPLAQVPREGARQEQAGEADQEAASRGADEKDVFDGYSAEYAADAAREAARNSFALHRAQRRQARQQQLAAPSGKTTTSEAKWNNNN